VLPHLSWSGFDPPGRRQDFCRASRPLAAHSSRVFIRGRPGELSNHAFGAAFDINFPWNPLGEVPALVGQRGCVRELVPIANRFGFFWGGHFHNRLDGNHFEVAQVMSPTEVAGLLSSPDFA
jgi:D-alanyl-D-alanine carboxypeptidase